MPNRLSSLLLALAAFATPLVFSPLSPSPFTIPKGLLLLVGLLLLTWLGSWTLARRRHLTLPRSPLLLPLSLFGASLLLNLIVIPTGRSEALLDRGSLYLLSTAFALIVLSVGTPRTSILKVALVASGATLALYTLLSLTYLHSLTFLPKLLQSLSFTPTGAPLTTLIYLVIIATFALTHFRHTSSNLAKSLSLVSGSLMVIAAIALGSLMLPGGELTPALLSYRASWSIALDAVKSPFSLLFGVGLGNFGTHYTSVKPLLVNASPLWNALPSSLTSEPLHLLTTLGLSGLLPFAALLYLGLKDRTNPSLILSSLALILTPASYPLVLLFFLLLALEYRRPGGIELKLSASLSLATALLLALLALTLAYYGSKVALAEYYMARAQIALNQGSGRGVYESTLEAVKLMPTVKNYRLAYSSTNLRLASALSQKGSLSDNERRSVADLVAQAVREGRVAVSLAPRDAIAWSNLGSLYRNLINVADGASQFALSAYGQAVTLDPGNPSLRLEFGGLYYQLASLTKDEAERTSYLTLARDQFAIAIKLKPDLPNAYYNLSHALSALNQAAPAYEAMQAAIRYLSPDAPDYQSALAELDKLRSSLPSPTPTPSPSNSAPQSPSDTTEDELSEPSPLPSPLPGGPVELPTAQ